MNDSSTRPPPRLAWILLAVAWFVVLCSVLDPKPLAAPSWAISFMGSLLGCKEPVARIITSVLIRLGGVAVLGAMVMLASGERGFTRRALLFLVCVPLLALAAMWVNYGYFPIMVQVKLIVTAAVAGALAGLALRRSWKAAGALALLLIVLFAQLTGYGMTDDLDTATRVQVKHLLASATALPDGDAGSIELIRQAFDLAAQRSVGGDPVLQNQGAVLALAVIIGHDKLADVAGRHIDPAVVPICDRLRARLSIHGRPDWARHFCVSAGLTLLRDDDRSTAIGILKELKDANPGGSGFSFGDLTADLAGNRFALASTRDVDAALRMQQRVSSGIAITDLFPDVRDLPEGIYAEEFHAVYGGVGGAMTNSLVNVIVQRLDGCAALR